MKKTEIAQWLHAITDECLFGDKPWPIEAPEEVSAMLCDLGLPEPVRGDDRAVRSTSFGDELRLDLLYGLHGPL